MRGYDAPVGIRSVWRKSQLTDTGFTQPAGELTDLIQSLVGPEGLTSRATARTRAMTSYAR